jgi:hypothetical protein
MTQRLNLYVKFHWIVFILVIVLILPALAGCSASGVSAGVDLNMAPMSDMPISLQQAPVSVREAYQFAVANPEALKNVPCYCGCGAVGHTSNYACYVTEVKPGGEIVFDQHALGCSICVDITQDVMKLIRQGKSPQEIRTAIDATFSQYGPSNMPRQGKRASN